LIDLSSDTATKPAEGMRRAMAEAEVGDEQRREDPTVNRLQELVAELTGKDAALFLPSGTMCNAIAFSVHCRRGEAVILHRYAHPYIAEGGGPAVIAGLLMRPVDVPRGVFGPQDIASLLDEGSTHTSRTSLISVENSCNQGGGKVWPLETLRQLRDLADERNMLLHMDGARLMNAVVAGGYSASEVASPVDTVWIDLSKGLGAPVGAVLAGPSDFIEEARLWKHRLGGAMRQAGVIAAAGIYAFEHNVERLAEDHENAKMLEHGISQAKGVEMVRGPVETNIVLFTVAGTGLSAKEFADLLLNDFGVRMSPYVDKSTIRAVTHLDVSRMECEKAIEAVQTLAGAC
jgi:threonine aldolase